MALSDLLEVIGDAEKQYSIVVFSEYGDVNDQELNHAGSESWSLGQQRLSPSRGGRGDCGFL